MCSKLNQVMIQIYDSYSKKYKEVSTNSINIYVCGITTSDYCHLGHAFSSVSFEILDIKSNISVFSKFVFPKRRYFITLQTQAPAGEE